MCLCLCCGRASGLRGAGGVRAGRPGRQVKRAFFWSLCPAASGLPAVPADHPAEHSDDHPGRSSCRSSGWQPMEKSGRPEYTLPEKCSPFCRGSDNCSGQDPGLGQDRAGPCRIVCRPSPPCAPPSGALSLLQPVPRQPRGHSPREDIICPGTRCGPWGTVVQGIGLCSSRWQVF